MKTLAGDSKIKPGQFNPELFGTGQNSKEL